MIPIPAGLTPETADHVIALARREEQRDGLTFRHEQAVAAVSRELAREMGFPEPDSDRIAFFTQIHDIGYLKMPIGLLSAPRAVRETNRVKLLDHIRHGLDLLGGASDARIGRDIIEHHHEKQDGSGHLRGLWGADIPVSAKIVAVADLYDEIRFDRMEGVVADHDEAVDMILKGRSTEHQGAIGPHLFDRNVLSAFWQAERRIAQIWKLYERPLDRMTWGLGATPVMGRPVGRAA